MKCVPAEKFGTESVALPPLKGKVVVNAITGCDRMAARSEAGGSDRRRYQAGWRRHQRAGSKRTASIKKRHGAGGDAAGRYGCSEGHRLARDRRVGAGRERRSRVALNDLAPCS